MNKFDFFILASLSMSAFLGFTRGFLKEILSILSYFTFFFSVAYFRPIIDPYLSNLIEVKFIHVLVEYFLLFLTILIIFSTINLFITHLLRISGLSYVNRILGMFFGSIRGLLIISILILIGDHSPLVKENCWNQSILLPFLKKLVDYIEIFLPFKITSFLSYL